MQDAEPLPEPAFAAAILNHPAFVAATPDARLTDFAASRPAWKAFFARISRVQYARPCACVPRRRSSARQGSRAEQRWCPVREAHGYGTVTP
ncbi:hypothetical protein [Streptomyces echinatus]|uniref:hypothetical protein n=1 Tax=Streptomyces echinatus TaxID=67293 RepID=UPI003787D9A2